MDAIDAQEHVIAKDASSVNSLRRVIVWVAVTYVLSWAWFAFLMSHGGYNSLQWALGPFLFMWVPGLTSLLFRLVYREGFRDIGWKWRNRSATLAAVWGPLIVGISVYAVLWGTGLAPVHQGNWGISFGDSTSHSCTGYPLLFLFLIAIAVMTPIASPFSLGEELGWRGYLLDRLIRSGLRRPVFVLGLIWAVWHLPVLLTGQYVKTDNLTITTILFVLMVLGLNSVTCRLWLVSRSIWVPVLIHSVHNVVFQNILQQATVENKWHTILGGEFGSLTVLAYGALAWLVWRKPIERSRP